MYVTRLELINYRNYEVLNLELSPSTNIIYGENAQGKTNIIEAIYTCCTTKSQRGSRDAEMIRFSEEEAHIRLHISKNDVENRIDMHLCNPGKKSVFVNGMMVKKASELYGMVNIVSFSPNDLTIIKNSPADRRRFIDMELSQLDHIYLDSLIKYNKILNQRNILLKQSGLNSNILETLSVWDEQLVKYGTFIIDARRKFINEMNEYAGAIHRRLSSDKEELNLEYAPSVSEDSFVQKLSDSLEKDRLTKNTNVGPHRDELIFYINGSNARRFGSQGQQRTIALALKLAEIELVRKRTGGWPILLLDDVMSELDRNRQLKLLECINETQTFITCTGLEELVRCRISYDMVYHVHDNKVDIEK